MKFSGKVWSDHGTTWLNFGSIRVNGSAGQRSICLLSPAIAQRTGVNKSVSFARWQQGGGVCCASHHSLFDLKNYPHWGIGTPNLHVRQCLWRGVEHMWSFLIVIVYYFSLFLVLFKCFQILLGWLSDIFVAVSITVFDNDNDVYFALATSDSRIGKYKTENN